MAKQRQGKNLIKKQNPINDLIAEIKADSLKEVLYLKNMHCPMVGHIRQRKD